MMNKKEKIGLLFVVVGICFCILAIVSLINIGEPGNAILFIVLMIPVGVFFILGKIFIRAAAEEDGHGDDDEDDDA
jgi:hypothetical protein